MAFSATPDGLLEEAARRAGTGDFGPEDFRDGFERLVAEFDAAGFSAEGEIAARENLLAALVGRLKAVAGFTAHPEAMARPIVRPLVITGIVRSGTTALHNLLSMDPQFQGPELWLCGAPQPRPPRASFPDNPDFRTASASLDAMIAISPEMLEDHGMAVDAVEESLPILAQSFCSNMYPSQFLVPAYDAWYRAADATFSYAYLANVLKLIGAQEPDRRWLVKNPTDTFAMQHLLNVFPDAMIVQTHRDPLQSVPSVTNLIGGAHRIFRGAATDNALVHAREVEFWAQALERAEAVKAANPGHVLDVQFRDFVRDQMATVARIYDHFGLGLSSEAEAAMRRWLAANPRRSTTLHRFTPEDYGGSTAALLDRYRGYRERYGYTD